MNFEVILIFMKQGRKRPIDIPERNIKPNVMTETHCNN